MDVVTSTRLRWGACAWLLTLQFFVVETIAQLRFQGPYSRVDDVISDLGTSASRAAQLMNASFVAQAALILGGVLLLRPALRATAGRVATVLLALAAAGVLLVGVFPSDGNGALHATGAVVHLVGSGIGLIALAYALRPRSEVLGTTLAALGLIGTAATILFVAGVTGYLGEGGTERAAAYALPLGLALTGVSLWRLVGTTPTADGADGETPSAAGHSAREERARARAERAQRERERDEALEAAAGRRTDDAGTRDDEESSGDADDPWAAPGGRRAD
jgi:hypothetical membrane protein